MADIKESVSKHFNIPFVTLTRKGEKYFLCSTGVLFSEKEFVSMEEDKLNNEYERRLQSEELYDYTYARNTGILRKKRGLGEKARSLQLAEEGSKETSQKDEERIEESKEIADSVRESNGTIQRAGRPVLVISALLAFTSVISMYISTLHTATYLKDYADVFSAWLMSASVTAYNSTAFEVSILFRKKRRYFLTTVFMFLWVLVTLFSMATTVSVFYDRFNFNEAQIIEVNSENDSQRLALELLQKKEKDLREAIDFKKKDIEYRQEREFSTNALREELNGLQNELQKNLTEQQELLSATPEASKTEGETVRKESLFTFLGRLLHINNGILEFIMSMLSAIFVNLIAPLSLSATTELLMKKEN